MYNAVRVSNFRGVQSLAVEDLGRLNLFVGPNNVGKTSLLEALWLFRNPNNPVLTMLLAGLRGFNPALLSPDSLWHALFPDMDVERPIDIEASRADGVTDTLAITLSNEWIGELESGNAQPLTSVATQATVASGPPQTLLFEYASDGGTPLSASFSLGLGRANYRADPELARRLERSSPPSPFLSARQRLSSEDLADRFTKVRDTGGVDSLVRSLNTIEPRLNDLSIGFSLVDRQPSLRAHLAGLKTPIPLQLLGEGVGRLTEILLAVTTAQDGVVLVDEIENGLYYRNLESAWRAIDVASKEANVQLFATTHSAECVQAALRAVSNGSEADFRLYRLERRDSVLHVVAYDHRTAEAAFDLQLEFR